MLTYRFGMQRYPGTTRGALIRVRIRSITVTTCFTSEPWLSNSGNIDQELVKIQNYIYDSPVDTA